MVDDCNGDDGKSEQPHHQQTIVAFVSPECNFLFPQFTIKHYAGDVTYDISEFCVKNTDNLYASLIGCMQQSSIPFLLARFPENMHDNKQAPTTAGTKIRTSAVNLVQVVSLSSL